MSYHHCNKGFSNFVGNASTGVREDTRGCKKHKHKYEDECHSPSPCPPFPCPPFPCPPFPPIPPTPVNPVLNVIAIDSNTSARLAGVTFSLTTTATTISPLVAATAITDGNGIAIFNLTAGASYLLENIASPIGYEVMPDTYQITVDAAGTVFVNGTATNYLTYPIDPIQMASSFTALKVDSLTRAPLLGGVFELQQNSTTIAMAVSDAEGNVSFSDLEPGTYTMIETIAPAGYARNLSAYLVSVSEAGIITINGLPADDFPLLNTRLGTMSFYKLDINDDPVEGATFSLSQNGTIVGTASSDINGQVNFGQIPAGSYTMVETAAPVGYLPNNTVYNVAIAADGAILIDGIPIGDFTITNIANPDFAFAKTDGINPLAGAEFTLTSSGGEQIVALSVVDGSVTFPSLAAGSYTLVETEAPLGFEPDPATYAVVVAANGTITVDGNPAAGFTVVNTPID